MCAAGGGGCRSTKIYLHRSACANQKEKCGKPFFDLPQFCFEEEKQGATSLSAAIDPTVSWPRLSFWLFRFWERLFSEPPWPGLSLFRERRAG